MIMTATTTTRSCDDAFLKVGPMLAEADGVGAGEGDFSPVGSDSGLLFDGGGI